MDNFNTQIIDGQEIFFPTEKQWEVIFETSLFQGRAVKLVDLIKSKVIRNRKYSELKCGLGVFDQWVLFYEFLVVDKELIRVFVERVICELCNNRATVSATPGVIDLYIGLADKQQAKVRGYKFPNLSCGHCDTPYHRRYTIWQAYD